jgi:hypothetical protein
MKGGEMKNQICKWWKKGENEMRDNYRFILLVRASYFRSMSRTISILEDLGHRCDWRTCHSRRGILDALKKFHKKILGCDGLLIPTDSSQRSFSRF